MMKRDNFIFKSEDEIDIYTNVWIPEGEIVGVIQIIHGMAEHSGRYERFAEFFTQRGYVVYGDDHRGHGKSVVNNEFGYLGEENGFLKMVKDEYRLHKLIKSKYPEKPIFIFAHSMGSFIAQMFIEKYKNLDCRVILSGTSGKNDSSIFYAKILAFVMTKIFGKKSKARVIDYLAFKDYNIRIKDKRTKFDWLSRDTEEVDKYVNDPLCGQLFPNSFFYELFKVLGIIHRDKNIKRISKKMPILLIGGDSDPVGNYGKRVISLFNDYKRLGIEDVTLKFYSEARHELLNETNYAEVLEDINHWISERT